MNALEVPATLQRERASDNLPLVPLLFREVVVRSDSVATPYGATTLRIMQVTSFAEKNINIRSLLCLYLTPHLINKQIYYST